MVSPSIRAEFVRAGKLESRDVGCYDLIEVSTWPGHTHVTTLASGEVPREMHADNVAVFRVVVVYVSTDPSDSGPFSR